LKKPIHLWFHYPIHLMDNGVLDNAWEVGNTPLWVKGMEKKKEAEAKRRELEAAEIGLVYDDLSKEGKVKLSAIADEIGVSVDVTRKRVHKTKQYDIDQGVVTRKEKTKADDAATEQEF